MKKIALFMALCLSVMGVNAQSEKNYIIKCARGNMTYIDPATIKAQETKLDKAVKVIGVVAQAASGAVSTTKHHPEYADAVSNAIAGAISSSYRLRTIDGQFLPEELESGEPLVYYDGSISTISTTYQTRLVRFEDKDGKSQTRTDYEYSGNIMASINIKDAYTDEIVKTIDILCSSYSGSWFATAEKAIGNAMEYMKEQIVRELNVAYPLYASIVEGNLAKKSKQKSVYIDLGAKDGVYEGLTFTVYEVGTVAGRETKKEIGRLKIDELMGDDISLCKVKRGKSDIKSAIDGGKTLLITSEY